MWSDYITAMPNVFSSSVLISRLQRQLFHNVFEAYPKRKSNLFTVSLSAASTSIFTFLEVLSAQTQSYFVAASLSLNLHSTQFVVTYQYCPRDPFESERIGKWMDGYQYCITNRHLCTCCYIYSILM